MVTTKKKPIVKPQINIKVDPRFLDLLNTFGQEHNHEKRMMVQVGIFVLLRLNAADREQMFRDFSHWAGDGFDRDKMLTLMSG